MRDVLYVTGNLLDVRNILSRDDCFIGCGDDKGDYRGKGKVKRVLCLIVVASFAGVIDIEMTQLRDGKERKDNNKEEEKE